MPRKKKTKPKLKVVFDTNVLFNQVAYDLVRKEVKQLIENNSQHVDLNIEWYMPRVVVDERRYQMRNKAFELLPSIEKLERLLGHKLNITKDILINRVDEAINQQLKELVISRLEINTKDVDWETLIKLSLFRLPPFDPGEKEKGFRDSLIAESFLQLVKQSPVTPSYCRLAMVTSDGPLAEFVKGSTKEKGNVRVLLSINELESLINTLVSKVSEEFVADMIKKASTYFLESGNKTGLYDKETIDDKIRESYGQELNATPKEGLLRENGTWWIDDPVFVKKERQRIFWITQINVDAKLFRYASPETTMGAPIVPTISPSLFNYVITPPGYKLPEPSVEQKYGGGWLAGFSPASPKKVEVSSGQSSFEIHWSVNITSKKRLTSPIIDKIEFISTKWDGEKT